MLGLFAEEHKHHKHPPAHLIGLDWFVMKLPNPQSCQYPFSNMPIVVGLGGLKDRRKIGANMSQQDFQICHLLTRTRSGTHANNSKPLCSVKANHKLTDGNCPKRFLSNLPVIQSCCVFAPSWRLPILLTAIGDGAGLTLDQFCVSCEGRKTCTSLTSQAGQLS